MWGLPGAEDGKELFPSFEQRGADRTGLGIGLAFSRWGAEASGGRLYARNLIRAASLPWICPGRQFPLSRSCRLNPHAEPLRDVPRGYRAGRSDPIMNANGR